MAKTRTNTSKQGAAVLFASLPSGGDYGWNGLLNFVTNLISYGDFDVYFIILNFLLF